MGEWVECNLPWDKALSKEYYDKVKELYKPIYHDLLEEKCLEKFGITYKQFLEEQHSYPTYWTNSQVFLVQNHNSYGKKIDEETALQLIINKFKDVDKTTIKCAERRLFEIQYNKWVQEQSEYIDWFSNRETQQDILYKEEIAKNKSFVNLGLDKVGTLIEIETVEGGQCEQLLIGDINAAGGMGDDEGCCYVQNRIVKRYKIVWEKINE